MQPLRIALTKGRLEKSTVALLEQTGMDCSQLRDKGRRLILPVGDGSLQAVLAKAADVITYVEHGVCDMGVVGKDTIMAVSYTHLGQHGNPVSSTGCLYCARFSFHDVV